MGILGFERVWVVPHVGSSLWKVSSHFRISNQSFASCSRACGDFQSFFVSSFVAKTQNYFSLISMRHVKLNEDHDFRFATRWTGSWWWCRIDEQLKCLIHCLIDSKLEACLPAASIHHVAAYEKSSAEKWKVKPKLFCFFQLRNDLEIKNDWKTKKTTKMRSWSKK